MKRYAELFPRYRGLIGAFVAAASLVALFGLTRLRFDDVPRGIFVADDSAHHRLERYWKEFGSDDNDVLIVLEVPDASQAPPASDASRGWFEPARVRLLREIEAGLGELALVESVTSLQDVVDFASSPPGSILPPESAGADEREAARRRALEHPLVAGRLLSPDGRTTLAVARLHGDALAIGAMGEALAEIRGVLGERIAALAPGVEARLTGVPAIRVVIYETIGREQGIFLIGGSLLCTAIALALFRSLGAVLVACLPPIVGVLWALGFAGLLGAKIDLLASVLPMLVMVIAFTDSVHLTIDVRIERSRGVGALASAASAIRHLGLPCALTSVTTAVGFGSLALGEVTTVSRFGTFAAGSVLVAFLAVITTFPLLASLVRDVGTSPEVPARGRGLAARAGAGLLGAARFLVARPRRSALGVLGVTVALLLVASRLVPENRLTEAIPRGSEAYRAFAHLERAFGGVLPISVVVSREGPAGAEGSAELPAPTEPLELGSPATLELLAEVEELLARTPGVHAPLSVRTLLASLPGGLERPDPWLALIPPETLRRLARPDLGKAVVTGFVPDGGSDVMVPLFSSVEEGLAGIEARHEGFGLALTGTDVVARSLINRLIESLGRSLGAATLVIFAVIALEFRSIRLGLASLVPNLFPLVLCAAVLVWTGRPLQISSAVLFSVLLGLAVDDTIHFLARHRREKEAGSPEPIARSFLAVGKAVSITTVVLSAGFALALLSTVPTSRLFAGLGCVGLLAALIGDLFFLPALIALVEGRGRRPTPS